MTWLAVGHLANGITLARLAAAVPIAWLIQADRYEAAFWIFAVAGVSDAVDGFIAKTLGRRTSFGVWTDPIADKVLLVSAFLALAVDGLLPVWVLALAVLRDVLLVAGALWLARIGQSDRVRPSLLGKLNTVLQIALVTVVLGTEAVLFDGATFELSLELAVAATTIASGIGYLWTVRRLSARMEPLA